MNLTDAALSAGMTMDAFINQTFRLGFVVNILKCCCPSWGVFVLIVIYAVHVFVRHTYTHTYTHTHTDTDADTPGAEQGTDCPLPLLSHYIRARGSFGWVRAVPPQTDSGSNKTCGIKVGRQVQEVPRWIGAGVTCALLRCRDPHTLSCLLFN